MDKFWELFGQSVIVQALITLILVITIVAMYFFEKDVPPDLMQALFLTLGFYFGSKTQHFAARQQARHNAEK